VGTKGFLAAIILSASIVVAGYLQSVGSSPVARAAADVSPPAASNTLGHVGVKDGNARQVYANVERVSLGPQAEEFTVDLGTLSKEEAHPDDYTMDVSTRVFLSVYEAKKLSMTLRQAIDRYEKQFGTIEIDPRKRMKDH